MKPTPSENVMTVLKFLVDSSSRENPSLRLPAEIFQHSSIKLKPCIKEDVKDGFIRKLLIRTIL